MGEGDEVRIAAIHPARERPSALELSADEPALGEGGMAVVRAAFDGELGRSLAYKQLRSTLMGNELAERAFITEAQVTAQLDHPHIVPVYELGQHTATADSDGASLYFTMKRVRGRTLAEMIDAEPVELRTQEQLFALVQVFAKVCDAIDFAHSRGVVHRDLKPENIMVGDYGQVFVLDWGIALIKRAGASAVDVEPPSDAFNSHVVGTPSYMSPEQASGLGDQIDERSDIFALGACLYEILTGRGPYSKPGAPTSLVILAAIECEVVPPQQLVTAGLPSQLSRVAMKSMSKNPDDRYQSVRELKVDVDRFLQTYSFFPRVTFAAGSIIVNEGDVADAIYVLVAGDADVVRNDDGREVHVRHLRSGDVFGEVAVFGNRGRTATVRALTDVIAVRISREQMSMDNEIGYWFNLFTKALSDRFLEKEQQIEALERRLERLMQKSE